MIEVYGINNCDKIRKTKKWLSQNEIEFDFFDLKKEPLSREELEEFVYRVGLDTLVNKRGMTWRKLGLKDKDLSEDELFEQLLENQSMIKRPVLINGEGILVGYDEDAFETFVD
ncbi:arsenate reductase family protein [Rhodohalobacter sulfatireducens]|uniref:Spx/MgsR family RNA polymerase-binding regulatory protein n=1 Tax=Rhodohalobacter sulfatireducens TaxID=2911366 RepID=A0ABS9KDF7_9BACT|nr:Spx/MgsR family RNA polymerase-binding regulatory protein [Rhodohalobacter sulfatireducens]MCG2588884.1 Spx/MgsR family RNA polymerase-binding regulatory protein [Rhodohalobacter sulfatireducens]